VGSKLQVALFVAPAFVQLSHLLDKPLDLMFTPLKLAKGGAAVLLVGLAAFD
jgi:Ca2+/H+ antiporter